VKVEEEYRFETEDGRKTLADLFDGRSQLLVDPDALAVWLPRDGMTGRSSISIGARARPTDWPDPRGRFGRSARRPPPTPTWLTRGSSKSSRRKGSIPLCASWSSPDMCQRRSSAVPVSRHWVSCGWPAQAFADIHSPSHSPKARSSSSHAGLRSFRRGLENRCGPYGPPRVRIPPPPLDPARVARTFTRARCECCLDGRGALCTGVDGAVGARPRRSRPT
jgi:Bacterial protein of unknown function (DUF899)